MAHMSAQYAATIQVCVETRDAMPLAAAYSPDAHGVRCAPEVELTTVAHRCPHHPEFIVPKLRKGPPHSFSFLVSSVGVVMVFQSPRHLPH